MMSMEYYESNENCNIRISETHLFVFKKDSLTRIPLDSIVDAKRYHENEVIVTWSDRKNRITVESNEKQFLECLCIAMGYDEGTYDFVQKYNPHISLVP